MNRFNGLMGKLKVKRASLSSALNDLDLYDNTTMTNYDQNKCDSTKDPQSLFIAQTLKEIVHNQQAVSYFINYLESIGKLNLYKFWLHIEGFKMSTKQLSEGGEVMGDPGKVIKSDAENIFATFIDQNAPYRLDISENLYRIISEKARRVEQTLDADCFAEAQVFVWKVLENMYLSEFLISEFYAGYCLETFTIRMITLEDVFRLHDLFSSFLEFLENIRKRELIEFVIAVDTFVETMTVDSDTQDDAILIYDRFFSHQATEPLDFSDAFRLEVETSICTENGCPKRDAFDRPRRLAVALLEGELLPQFVKSSFYTKFINKLRSHAEKSHDHRSQPQSSRSHSRFSLPQIKSYPPNTSSSRENPSSPSMDPSDGASQCSSEQNCLLAPLISNDSKQKDGDTLKNGSSCLAVVDQFGRYRSLFDSTLSDNGELRSRHRLRDTMDKYLRTTMTKESLVADEIAELIIRDIKQMATSRNSKTSTS